MERTDDSFVGSPLSDPFTDLYLAETPEPSDLACSDGRPLRGRSSVEDLDRSHLVFERSAESQPVAGRTVPEIIRTYAIFSPAGAAL